MDVQVQSDNPDAVTGTPTPLPEADRPAARSIRRFEIDPASSPMLLAALAWTAPPRR